MAGEWDVVFRYMVKTMRSSWWVSANLFHIQEGSRVLWIPKRAFAGEAEINQMRELLRSKLNCTTA